MQRQLVSRNSTHPVQWGRPMAKRLRAAILIRRLGDIFVLRPPLRGASTPAEPQYLVERALQISQYGLSG